MVQTPWSTTQWGLGQVLKTVTSDAFKELKDFFSFLLLLFFLNVALVCNIPQLDLSNWKQLKGILNLINKAACLTENTSE